MSDAAGTRISRRALFGGGLAMTGAALGGGVAGHAAGSGGDPSTMPSVTADAGPGAGGAPGTPAVHGPVTEPFWGDHQAGVTTPQQTHAVFLGLDLAPDLGASRVATLMRMLTDDAARLTSGRPPLGAVDTALAAAPARLTITFGFGAGFFDAAGRGDDCPEYVRSMPAFETDRLDPRWGPTDLLIQLSSDDPVSLTHAQRRVLRDALDFGSLRWAQRGFIPARGTEPDGTTPRNLMGMRDGSANESDPAQVAAVVWGDGSSPTPGWSQMVLRRIRIDMTTWDDLDVTTKETAFGRRIDSGAPLTGSVESDVVDRVAVDDRGLAIIAPNAHAARAQARSAAERMIRRSYNYTDDGPDGLEEGLLFCAFQADLGTAFVPVQRRLAESDALNLWTTHVGSAAYAIPPGAKPGSYVGASLLRT